MASPGDSMGSLSFPSRSRQRLLLRACVGSRTGRLLAILATVCVVGVYRHLLYKQTVSSGPSRCWDAGDDPQEIQPVGECLCPDPSIPTEREDRHKVQWHRHHGRMVDQAEKAPHDLDMVMLGDSITERLNGTRGNGADVLADHVENFAKYFHKGDGALIEGLALGSSGDTTTDLLYHLQNGILPETLNPKVWVILIGTNNIGRFGCSKRTVFAGILEVLSYLRKHRPHVPILLYGLLPRSDHFAQEPVDYRLGHMWNAILWINTNLNDYCSTNSDQCRYVEANRLFMREPPSGRGNMQIIKEMLPDALHPSLEGYQAWAPRIVQQVQNQL